MNIFWSTFRLFLVMTALTGLIYPLLITLYAKALFPKRSHGDLIVVNDKTVGAKNIAQKFTSEKYFWPRPSAGDYTTLPSGGSNLGPTSAALKSLVDERRKMLSKTSSLAIPDELLYASGSGLDPDITPIAAYFQVERIAKARGLNGESGTVLLIQLIDDHTHWGVVNVLLLNIALDGLKHEG
jgi:K+-transporting ATPase ATPase C chain